MKYTKEQLKAAYALNLCTVSVSQIIDYNDINVMEQEYEAILNNLNLEEMPKDEALLKILKHLLDTITFFRIHETDKKLLELEYQNNIKNAIWSAVPSISTLTLAINPTSLVALASTVGISYMNYRKNKANIKSSYERNLWDLEKTAIEQFHGLRRELFDTAWRLASVHNFPDELRLTEKQITQYNTILMDDNIIRKYARLDVVKDNFLAYPSFWYHFGNTANMIANSSLKIGKETREHYKVLAKEHFYKYREINNFSVLREDTIAASCALELLELLDINEDKNLISKLIDEAIKYSGRECDVLQIAVITNLQMNEKVKAIEYLEELVNEEYNMVLNSQILSSLYVNEYLKSKNEIVKNKYEILSNQIDPSYLYPMPQSLDVKFNEIETSFMDSQKMILAKKYSYTINALLEKYIIMYGKLIPVSDSSAYYSNSFFYEGQEYFQERKYDLAKIFANKKKHNLYINELAEVQLPYAILELLNDLFDTCSKLPFINSTNINTLALHIEKAIKNNSAKLNEIQSKLDNEEFNSLDMDNLLQLNFSQFTKEFFAELIKSMIIYINSRAEMQDFIIAETILSDFCLNEGIKEVNINLEDDNENNQDELQVYKRFNIKLLGKIEEIELDEISASAKMLELIISFKEKIIDDITLSCFHVMGEPEMERYFRDNSRIKSNNELMSSTIAIFDDLSEKGDFDLIFTIYGIRPIKNGYLKNLVCYKDIKWNTEKEPYLDINGKFSTVGVDSYLLYQLIDELKEFAKASEKEKFGIDSLLQLKPKFM